MLHLVNEDCSILLVVDMTELKLNILYTIDQIIQYLIILDLMWFKTKHFAFNFSRGKNNFLVILGK